LESELRAQASRFDVGDRVIGTGTVRGDAKWRAFCGAEALAVHGVRSESSAGPAASGDHRLCGEDSMRSVHGGSAAPMAMCDAIQCIAFEWPCHVSRLVTRELRQQGWRVNRKKVQRLMREDNLLKPHMIRLHHTPQKLPHLESYFCMHMMRDTFKELNNGFRTWKNNDQRQAGMGRGSSMKYRFLHNWLNRLVNRHNADAHVFRQRNGKMVTLNRLANPARISRFLQQEYTYELVIVRNSRGAIAHKLYKLVHAVKHPVNTGE
jgi:hypothetical protein